MIGTTSGIVGGGVGTAATSPLSTMGRINDSPVVGVVACEDKEM